MDFKRGFGENTFGSRNPCQGPVIIYANVFNISLNYSLRKYFSHLQVRCSDETSLVKHMSSYVGLERSYSCLGRDVGHSCLGVFVICGGFKENTKK